MRGTFFGLVNLICSTFSVEFLNEHILDSCKRAWFSKTKILMIDSSIWEIPFTYPREVYM